MPSRPQDCGDLLPPGAVLLRGRGHRPTWIPAELGLRLTEPPTTSGRGHRSPCRWHQDAHGACAAGRASLRGRADRARCASAVPHRSCLNLTTAPGGRVENRRRDDPRGTRHQRQVRFEGPKARPSSAHFRRTERPVIHRPSVSRTFTTSPSPSVSALRTASFTGRKYVPSRGNIEVVNSEPPIQARTGITPQ